MKALTVSPGQAASLALADREPPQPSDDQVLVRVLEVGIDGTDKALLTGKHGRAPEGEDRLVIGHESLGVVAAVGKNVHELREGELVVATVRRPCRERCAPCTSAQLDLCATGHYVERGIQGAHGYATELYVDAPRWLVRVPNTLRAIAVLAEPASVALKGIERAYALQADFDWHAQRALVIGAGSLGLLATLLLRGRGLDVHVVDRAPPDGPKAQLVRSVDAHYLKADGRALGELVRDAGPFALVFEATGASKLVFEAMCVLGRNGVLCAAGLPETDQRIQIPGDCIGLEMVLDNRIFFGTVSSNRGHFERALEALAGIERRFPHAAARIMTARVPLDRFAEAFSHDGIKAVLTVSEF